MQWREEYLHFIWKYQLFDTKMLRTTLGEAVVVLKTGLLNTHQGPDFMHSSVQIGSQILHGHIELHIDNKDWYQHAHQKDKNYDNVILHVVLHNTAEVYTLAASHHSIPILCLEKHIRAETLQNLSSLIDAKKDIPCHDIHTMPSGIVIEQFKSRLFIERILRKSSQLQSILKANLYHYENAFYQAMLYGFGIKENSEYFLRLAQSIPQNLLAKYKNQPMKLEALFFGQANLLKELDDYSRELSQEYAYLKSLHQLSALPNQPKRSRMLPASFPTLRLAQFVGFIQNKSNLYSKLLHFQDLKEIYPYFDTDVSLYWTKHYDFGKTQHDPTDRKITHAFIEKIITNIILPFRFLKEMEEEKSTETSLQLYHQLKPENNIKTRALQNSLSFKNQSAFDSQALIEWYSNYCQKKKCLDCPVGYETLRKG